MKRYLLMAGVTLCALSQAATTAGPFTLHSGGGTGAALRCVGAPSGSPSCKYATHALCVKASDERKLVASQCKAANTYKPDVVVPPPVTGYPSPAPAATVPVPTATIAPSTPVPAMVDHSSTHWLVTVPALPARLNVFTQPSSDPAFNYTQQTELGSVAAGVTAFLVPKTAGAWLRIGAENSAGYSPEKSTPLQLFVGPVVVVPPVVIPPTGVQPLASNDPRVLWWVRADQSNAQIGARAPWTGVQGSALSPQYAEISTVPEPNVYNGRVILARSGGYFQHRIWDGMPLWKDATSSRQRSAIHTTGSVMAGTSDLLRGKSYWFAFGGKFYADMFSQSNPSEDRTTNFMDFHHDAPSSAMSGATPWAGYADANGYEIRLVWNPSDSGIFSPTGERNWDGAQKLTLIRDNSKDTTRPHFFAFRFKLDFDSSAYVEAYRQLGVDGPITRLGRWNVPTTYSGSGDHLYPKYGLHQWYGTLTGAPTRSIDMAGALIVEDVTVPPEVIFRSLTVAIPRP